MIEMGLLVALGLLVLLAKSPWKVKLWIVSHPILVDLVVFALLFILHWGTFSGGMVATVGALFCSLTLSCARWLIGFVEAGVYRPGRFDILHKVKA